MLLKISFIQKNYLGELHLYGGTGTGGVLAQAIASDKDLSFFKTFSQLGSANYRDLSPLGNSLMFKLLYPIIRASAVLFPNYRLKFRIPKYNGINAEKENAWYQNIMNKYPGIFDLSMDVVSTIMWLFISRKSPLREVQKIPTLVMAAEHDRYYSHEYVKKYFEKLPVQKKLHWLNDSHCVFEWGSELLAKEVIIWIIEENKNTINSSLDDRALR